MRDSLRLCCGIGLCFMAVLLMFAAPASAAVLNLNFGESSSGQEINNGETWNNLIGSSGTTGSLQYSDSSAATGISATQSVGAGGGNNSNDANGAGYVTGLDSVTTSLLFANVGASRTITATVSGLAVGSLWDVDLYGGLSSYAATNYTFGVNGSSQTMNRVALYNTHAPLPFTGVAANSSGEIVISVGPGSVGNATKAIEGASLTYVSGPIIGSGGDPDPDWNGNAMQLWLKADDGVEKSAGVAAGDGETVQYWRDKSNNTYDATQSNSGKRPKFVASAHYGKPALEFDGGDDFLDLGDVLDQEKNDFTIFTVFSSPFRSVSENERLLAKASGSDKYETCIFREGHSSIDEGMYIFYGDGSNSGYAGGVGGDYSKLLDGSLHISTSVVDFEDTISQYLDGGTPATADISHITGSQSNSSSLCIGASSSGSYTFQGQIAEILMYQAALSDSDRQAVESYLMTKYAPEPSALVLALFGLIGLLGRARRRRSDQGN